MRIMIGAFLCLIGVLIMLYNFPDMKMLALIPIALFVISIFISQPFLYYFLNSLTIIPFFLAFFFFRLPNGQSIELESRIRYQMVDIGQGGGLIRNILESTVNNRRIFLADPTDEFKWVYVDRTDVKKLWPEPPFTMREKNYTIKAKFKINKLLLGGYSRAEILSVEKVEGKPMISK